ncbi:hypothetical protein B0H11DRAFT_2251429 [Mycena galericulata]|nr:hypothetical protein B0H11DRAFT_2251429 [Mycena galericulata]
MTRLRTRMCRPDICAPDDKLPCIAPVHAHLTDNDSEDPEPGTIRASAQMGRPPSMEEEQEDDYGREHSDTNSQDDDIPLAQRIPPTLVAHFKARRVRGTGCGDTDLDMAGSSTDEE